MSLNEQATRVLQGTKDTLKVLINKMGGEVTNELIDKYPELAEGIVIDHPNADWNENDADSDAYILNRPFYISGHEKAAISVSQGDSEPTVILENRIVNFYEGEGSLSNLMGENAYVNGDVLFVYGATYWVVWDGVEYECTLQIAGDEYFELGARDGSYPFCFGQAPYGMSVLIAYNSDGSVDMETEEHTVSVYEMSETVVKVPNKYLPEELFATPNWETNDPNDPSYIKNRPFSETRWWEPMYIGGVYADEKSITCTDGVADWSAVFGTGVDSTFGKESAPQQIILDGNTTESYWWDDNGALRASFSFEGSEKIVKLVNHYSAEEPYMELFYYTGYDDEGNLVLETGTVEHIITVLHEVANVQKISDQYLTQPDWNNNDEESAAYVKNKPFGSVYNLKTIINRWNVDPAESDDDYFIWGIEAPFLTSGKEYTVEWDGKHYANLVAWDGGDGYIYLGGHSGFHDLWPGGDETPFVFTDVGNQYRLYCGIYVLKSGEWQRKTRGNSSECYLYEILSEEVTKIPDKYLPDDIGVQSDWNEKDEASKAYIQNRPFGPMKDWNVVFDEWGVVFEEDTTYPGVYAFSTDNAIAGLHHPEAVKVTFDDTLYECSYLSTDSLPSVRFGNRSIIDNAAEDTGEPFYVTSWIDAGAASFGTEIYTKETDEEHSITIEFFQEYTKLLTHNYIDMADAVENYNYGPVSSHVVKKYVDNAIEASGVQSDWNENDENSKAYILNRPFYSDVGYSIAKSSISGAEMIDIELDSMSADGRYYFSHVMGNDEDSGLCGMFYYEGRDYRVVWDGVEYECTAYWNDEESYFGLGGDGLPFKFEHIGNVVYAYAYDSNGNLLLDSDSHIFSAYEKGEVVVKIPEKYIPDTVATKADLEAAIGAAISASY